jgi:hypothetical protein
MRTPVIVMRLSQTGTVGATVGVAVSKARRVGAGTREGVEPQAERAIKRIQTINRHPAFFPVIDSFPNHGKPISPISAILERRHDRLSHLCW